MKQTDTIIHANGINHSTQRSPVFWNWVRPNLDALAPNTGWRFKRAALNIYDGDNNG